MRTLGLILRCTLAITGCGSAVAGQAVQPANLSAPRAGAAVRSPEVGSDGRVTFRFVAPGAHAVSLAREGEPRVPMRQGERGIWSVTTDSLPPDFYLYTFVVDGVALADPANPLSNPVVVGGNESIVHVPGPAALPWEMNDVPHGTLHKHLYASSALGETREFWVYTPPGYRPADRRTYPVLYLLHGVMDDASAWTAAGRANVILDNLIARGQARPMLLVMPLGYGFPHAPDRMAKAFSLVDQPEAMKVLAASLLDEVIPQVERAYRVTPGRNARAIAGLSMGGAQALSIGLNHPDRFASIGSFSGALVMYGGQFEQWFPRLSVDANARIHVLWLACGTDDFLVGVNRYFGDWLTSRGVRFTTTETPGAHVWTVWRRNLSMFLPLLFRGQGR